MRNEPQRENKNDNKARSLAVNKPQRSFRNNASKAAQTIIAETSFTLSSRISNSTPLKTPKISFTTWRLKDKIYESHFLCTGGHWQGYMIYGKFLFAIFLTNILYKCQACVCGLKTCTKLNGPFHRGHVIGRKAHIISFINDCLSPSVVTESHSSEPPFLLAVVTPIKYTFTGIFWLFSTRQLLIIYIQQAASYRQKWRNQIVCRKVILQL